MLKLDCLLVNTQVKETMKKLVGYLGHKGLADGEDVSFNAMYHKLRKLQVEIDKESLAHIYASELPIDDGRFTSMEDLYHQSGKWREDLVRAMMLQKPKTGEIEIGDLSPSDAVINGIGSAFLKSKTADERTQSMAKKLENIYREHSKRFLGELADTSAPDTRTTSEIVKEAIDNEALGHKNLVDGTINGLAKIHEAVKGGVEKMAKEMEAEGEFEAADEFRSYAQELQDSAYTLMFSAGEAKKVQLNAFRDNGFTKLTKNGKEVIDWQKLAGTQNSYEHLRQNIVSSLKKAGFSEDIGGRVADSMRKEFRDIRGKMQEVAHNEQQGLADTWNKQPTAPGAPKDVVSERLKRWENYKLLVEDDTKPLTFARSEANRIVSEAIRDLGNVKSVNGRDVIDYEKFADNARNKYDVQAMVKKAIEDQGYDHATAQEVADSVKQMSDEFFGKVAEYVKSREAKTEDSWLQQNNPGANQTSIKDLAEQRLKQSEQHKQIVGTDSGHLSFKKHEGDRIVREALRDSQFGKDTPTGRVVDWNKMSQTAPTEAEMQKAVSDFLQKEGVSQADADRIADSVKSLYPEVHGKIGEYLKNRNTESEATWLQQNGGANAPQRTMIDMVKSRMKQSGQMQQFAGASGNRMLFKKHEGNWIMGETLKASDQFGRDTASGRIIDWQKLAENPPTEVDIENMVFDHLHAQGLSPREAHEVALAIKDIYPELATDIQAHAQKILDARQMALDRDSPRRRSDLHRLAELHDLGIFNGAHDRLLAHVLGIEQSDIQAVQGIKQYAEKLSKLRQVMSGNDFIVPSMVHTLNREIHSIMAPLIENKSTSMKVVSTLNKIFQVENSMLISTHGNLLENHLSGALELLTTNLSQRLKLGGELGGMKGQDWQFMKDMYRHIAEGGAEYGLAPHQVGGSKVRPTDKYNIHKMRGADWSRPGTWAKGLATAVLTIPRTFLSGADSAVKVGLMNAHMKSAVVEAIMANSDGKIDMDTAVQMYNDAIYGPGQLAAAKAKAEQIYRHIGMDYVSQKELNITANELLRENLIQNRLIKAEELQDLMDNSFKEAGLGMGHESNNFFSARQQSWKRELNRREQVALSENDWDKAARIRLGNTMLNDVVFRFAASRFNWAWIRAQQAGVGLLTGLYHYSVAGKKFKNMDLLNMKAEDRIEKMNEMAMEYQAARQKLARGAVGLGVSAAAYLAAKAIAQAMNPDEEDPTKKMYDDLKGNYAAKALFLKVAPLWMLQSYEYNETKHGDAFDKSVAATGKDFINLTNVGDKHDFSVQLYQAIKNISDGKSGKMRNRGYAELGKAMNNFIPHVPLYKQGKNVGQFVNWAAGGEPKPMPPFPNNFWQGMLYGGIIQDVFSTVPAEHLPQSLSAWGVHPEVKMEAVD